MSIFRLSLQYNDSYAFRMYPILNEVQRIHQEFIPDMSGTSLPGIQRCEACGELLAKWEEPLNGLLIKKRRYDVSSTYDGILVASDRFKTVYEEYALCGLKFRQLPDDPAFFEIQATKIVEFDAERRGTQFENQCPMCGRYESIIGATPVYLKPGNDIGEREFVRTDLEFASDDQKSPLLLCGEAAANGLRHAKLKGLDLIVVDNDALSSRRS